MKSKDWGRGRGEGLNREGVLINFPPLERWGLFERRGGGGGLIEDLRYIKKRTLSSAKNILKQIIHI